METFDFAAWNAGSSDQTAGAAFTDAVSEPSSDRAAARLTRDLGQLADRGWPVPWWASPAECGAPFASSSRVWTGIGDRELLAQPMLSIVGTREIGAGELAWLTRFVGELVEAAGLPVVSTAIPECLVNACTIGRSE